MSDPFFHNIDHIIIYARTIKYNTMIVYGNIIRLHYVLVIPILYERRRHFSRR